MKEGVESHFIKWKMDMVKFENAFRLLEHHLNTNPQKFAAMHRAVFMPCWKKSPFFGFDIKTQDLEHLFF